MGNLGYELKKTHNLIKRYVESTVKDGEDKSVTFMYRRISGFLYNNKDRDIFQKDIEKEFSLRRSTASVLIGKMEEKGLLKRVAVKGDKRLKKLLLTPSNEEKCSHFCEELEKLERVLTKDLNEDEISSFINTIHHIQNNLIESNIFKG